MILNMLWPYIPKNLGMGVNFSTVQRRLYPVWASVVRDMREYTVTISVVQWCDRRKINGLGFRFALA